MSSSLPPAPAHATVSVVLATSSARTVRRTLGCYRAQSVAARVEVVVVAPASELAAIAVDDAPELARLVRVAAEEPFELARERARGVLAGTAPWVFVGETHSFPAPTMIERLLSALDEAPREDAPLCLTPTIDNVNPSGATSWASLLIDYGAWGPGQRPADVVSPPIYNALLDRATVVARGSDLARALSPHDDSVFPLPAGSAARTRLVPEATIGHLNVERIADFVRSKRWLGLAIGEARASRWSRVRSVAYAAASPLIAALLFTRYLAAMRAVGSARRLPFGTLPRLALGAIVRAAGEAQGYLGATPASVAARLQHLEIHKADYVPGWRE